MKVKYRTNPEIERFVFGEFVEVCPLGIQNFESGERPEPDILCRLENGTQLAFELTRVDDREIIEKDQHEFRLTQELMEARDSLKEPALFRGHAVRINFHNCKFREQFDLVPKVIETLNEIGPVKSHGIRRNGKLICSIQCIDYSFDIPAQISCSSASNVGDYTIANIKAKLDKNYTTEHEIHLLAWANTTWLPDLWRDELTKLCQRQTKFTRVWVFGRAKHLIVFDSGSLAG